MATNLDLNQDQVQKAAKALLKHVENIKKSQPSQLFGDEDWIQLIITLNTIPLDRKKNKPTALPLPHSIFPAEAQVCIFVKDPQKEHKQKIAEEGIQVAKVIGLSKLKTNYRQYEERRKLCNSYDLFVADDRIIPSLPRVLGKSFFSKKKQPLPIRLNHLASELTKAKNSTYFFLGTGTSCSVKIGRTNFNADQLVENIMAALQGALKFIPNGGQNIRSLFIKTSESIPLPIYDKLPEPSAEVEEVKMEEEKQETKKSGKSRTPQKDKTSESNNEASVTPTKKTPKKKETKSPALEKTTPTEKKTETQPELTAENNTTPTKKTPKKQAESSITESTVTPPKISNKKTPSKTPNNTPVKAKVETPKTETPTAKTTTKKSPSTTKEQKKSPATTKDQKKTPNKEETMEVSETPTSRKRANSSTPTGSAKKSKVPFIKH